MRFTPLPLTLTVSLLTGAPAYASEPEANFFWQNCIAFGEFRDGAYSSETTLTTTERYAARENNKTFQYVLSTVRKKVELDAEDIARFHTQIDEAGMMDENAYTRLAPKMGYQTRQDMIAFDLCMH